MQLRWTSKALTDVVRLHQFLASANRQAAARLMKSLIAAPTTLSVSPRIGERLEAFSPREVRRLLIGNYEMRYEIAESAIYILRVWHTREER